MNGMVVRFHARAPRCIAAFLSSVLMLGLSPAARAENGVTPKEIRIGIVNDQSGPSDSPANKHFNAAANVYMDKVNKAGGVNGRQLKAIYYDDVYEPEKTVSLARKAIEGDQVFMLMNFAGTPTTKATLPLLEKTGVPFLFPRTGDVSIRAFQPNIFNLRASYQDEILALVKEVVVKRKLKKVAILMQADGFGTVIKSSVMSAYNDLGLMDDVRKRGTAFVAEGITQRNAMNLDEPFKVIAKAEPEVVLLAVPPGPALQFIKKVEAEKKKWQLMAVSNNGALVDQLGGEGQGMLISQVMPLVEFSPLPIVKQFRADMEAAGEKAHINGLGFEGYLNTVVAVEALRKAGTALTHASLIKALEAAPFDVGGLKVEYSAKSHQAKLPISIATVKGNKLTE